MHHLIISYLIRDYNMYEICAIISNRLQLQSLRKQRKINYYKESSLYFYNVT